METYLFAIIFILIGVVILMGIMIEICCKELRELRVVHQETCQKLETAQCKFKCKHLANEILEAEFLED